MNRLPEDSEARKELPMATGLLDYFPEALAAVAQVSKIGNDKHNPGQPIHWARGKSNDHADCIVRHLVDRGHVDKAGHRHSAYLAWRALALLQEEIENDRSLPLPRGAWYESCPYPKPKKWVNDINPENGCGVIGWVDVDYQPPKPRPGQIYGQRQEQMDPVNYGTVSTRFAASPGVKK